MTDASQLKPCPLCASDDVILHQVTKDGGWGVLCRTCHTYQDTRTDRSTAIAVWNRRPNPSGDADVREAARIVACHLPFPECPDTVCLPVTVTAGDLRAIYAALTGNASTDRAGTQACKAEVSPDLPTDWSEKMAAAPQGGGEAVIERLREIHRRHPEEHDEVCGIIDAIRLAALKPQTPDVTPDVTTADDLKASIRAWLDADDPTHWGAFENALDRAVSDDQTPDVLGEGRAWPLEVVALFEQAARVAAIAERFGNLPDNEAISIVRAGTGKQGHLDLITLRRLQMAVRKFPPFREVPVELLKAVEGIDDDYMTSEAHHPGYVLIPTAKFDAIVAALATPPGDVLGGEGEGR